MAHQLRDVLQALAALYQPGAVGVPEGVPDPLRVTGVAQEGPLALPVFVQGVWVEGEQAPGLPGLLGSLENQRDRPESENVILGSILRSGRNMSGWLRPAVSAWKSSARTENS